MSLEPEASNVVVTSTALESRVEVSYGWRLGYRATISEALVASMFGGGAPPDRKIRYLSGGPFSMSSDLCIVVDCQACFFLF